MRRRIGIIMLTLLVLYAASYVAAPAFKGFHIGCNVLAGDNVRETHVGILWCKHSAAGPEANEREAGGAEAAGG